MLCILIKKALLPVPLKSVNIAASATVEDSRFTSTKAKSLTYNKIRRQAEAKLKTRNALN